MKEILYVPYNSKPYCKSYIFEYPESIIVLVVFPKSPGIMRFYLGPTSGGISFSFDAVYPGLIIRPLHGQSTSWFQNTPLDRAVLMLFNRTETVKVFIVQPYLIQGVRGINQWAQYNHFLY